MGILYCGIPWESYVVFVTISDVFTFVFPCRRLPAVFARIYTRFNPTLAPNFVANFLLFSLRTT